MKYEIVRGVLESKNGLREIILSKKAEDGLLINTPTDHLPNINESPRSIDPITTLTTHDIFIESLILL